MGAGFLGFGGLAILATGSVWLLLALSFIGWKPLWEFAYELLRQVCLFIYGFFCVIDFICIFGSLGMMLLDLLSGIGWIFMLFL
ncbi:MAG TPA: hypothetical protein PKO06_04385 [Candidatus Ozemobacteraceae bacterium]|nr:hypothetical protein [Candidatus Ozemobacteraceae bacterium]